VSLDEFGDIQANVLDHIEEEFENSLDHYVEFITIAFFDFLIFFNV
jgi:hypothetical protein